MVLNMGKFSDEANQSCVMVDDRKEWIPLLIWQLFIE